MKDKFKPYTKDLQLESWWYILYGSITTSDNTITFRTFENKPTVALSVIVKVVV